MDLIKSIMECLGRPSTHDNAPRYTDIKEQYSDAASDHDSTAEDFVTALRTAEKNGADLQRTLNNIIHRSGTMHDASWTESLAKAILNKLAEILTSDAAMGQAMKENVEKAVNAAVGFAREHPVYCTLIAIGVLVLVAPWALEALGFGEMGIAEGSWAAAWQARYAGYVPKGSLFSYLQSLGTKMKWNIEDSK